MILYLLEPTHFSSPNMPNALVLFSKNTVLNEIEIYVKNKMIFSHLVRKGIHTTHLTLL